MPDRDAILNALRVVVDPDLRRDIVSLGFVKDVVADGGNVSLTIELTTPACPVKDQMRDQAVAAVRALPGVSKATVTMTAKVRSASAPETGKTPLPGVKNVIAVGAGKGGVGKTTVAVNLALALAQVRQPRRHPRRRHLRAERARSCWASSTQLTTDGKQIVPAEKYGVQVVSIGFLTDDDSPVIWRGPMLHGAIQQFFKEVAWRRPRLPDRRHATGHRRRGAQPQPDRPGRRRHRRDHAAAGVAGRQPPRHPDVSEAHDSDASASSRT